MKQNCIFAPNISQEVKNMYELWYIFDSRETFIKLLLKIKQLPPKTCVKVKKKKMITDIEKVKCYTFI